MSFNVPHLTYNQLRAAADAFLKRYHSSRKIPIPIEQIIEFQMGLDIVPLPGLLEAYGVDGFTSSDLSEISVDQFVYEHRPARYRFTLAHEVGHVVLHAELFRAHRFRGIEAWKRFLMGVPELDYSRLEWQAYSFGGLVLVPGDMLQQELKVAAKQVKAQGLSQETDFAKALTTDIVATRFGVSSEVIERRLGYEQIKLASFWP